MEFLDSIGAFFGISGVQLVIVVAAAIGLMVVWAAIRSFLRMAFRLFAVGCVVILGIAFALWILFAIFR